MDQAVGAFCLSCEQALQTVPINERMAACAKCGHRVVADDRFREAMAIATADEAWIEKVYWTQIDHGVWSVLKMFLIDLPLTAIVYVGPFLSFCSIALVGNYFGRPGLTWWQWLCIPTGFFIAYLFFRLLRFGLHKAFPIQHASAISFIVSSRGLIFVAPYPKPLYLPWSSIVEYSWHSDAGSLTSQIRIDYATADQGVANVILDGEERVQPLGELVDILKARLRR